jgi:hypothetical protein
MGLVGGMEVYALVSASPPHELQYGKYTHGKYKHGEHDTHELQYGKYKHGKHDTHELTVW